MKSLLFLMLLATAITVHAQAACPPGTIPYGTGNGQGVCGPDDSEAQQFQVRPEVWIDHYGAVATDAINGIIGVAIDEMTQAQAERKALEDCQAKGGTACKDHTWYVNQCIAMVAGDMGYNIKAGATIPDAENKAMQVCSADTDHCYTYYSACSMPSRIQ